LSAGKEIHYPSWFMSKSLYNYPEILKVREVVGTPIRTKADDITRFW
jgi:hypothetical protein